MGPNAWLWFVPVKTALGDGITFPTRIPLTECSTFHSIGESFTFSSLQLNAFKIWRINPKNHLKNQLQGNLYQVGQKPPVVHWSTRCWDQKGNPSSPPCPPQQGEAWARTAGWRSPRTSRRCWSRTPSPLTVELLKLRSLNGEKSQSKSNHEVWKCQVNPWFLNPNEGLTQESWARTTNWCKVVILYPPLIACGTSKTVVEVLDSICPFLHHQNFLFLEPSLLSSRRQFNDKLSLLYHRVPIFWVNSIDPIFPHLLIFMVCCLSTNLFSILKLLL